MKEFTVKQSNDFRLKVRVSDCSIPAGLKNIEFVQQQLDDFKNIRTESTYQFFLTDEQINVLCRGLLNDNDSN